MGTAHRDLVLLTLPVLEARHERVGAAREHLGTETRLRLRGAAHRAEDGVKLLLVADTDRAELLDLVGVELPGVKL